MAGQGGDPAARGQRRLAGGVVLGPPLCGAVAALGPSPQLLAGRVGEAGVPGCDGRRRPRLCVGERQQRGVASDGGSGAAKPRGGGLAVPVLPGLALRAVRGPTARHRHARSGRPHTMALRPPEPHLAALARCPACHPLQRRGVLRRGDHHRWVEQDAQLPWVHSAPEPARRRVAGAGRPGALAAPGCRLQLGCWDTAGFGVDGVRGRQLLTSCSALFCK